MIIPAGYAQCAITFSGTPWQYGAAATFGIARIGSPLDPTEVATYIADAFADEFASLVSTDLNISGAKVKFGPNDDGPSGEVSQSRFGSLTSPPMLANAAYLLEKHTALGGRKHRGRMYIPGCTEDGQTGTNDVIPARLGQLATACNNFLGKLEAEGFSMVILHNSVNAPTEVTSLTPDGKYATQRRRLRR